MVIGLVIFSNTLLLANTSQETFDALVVEGAAFIDWRDEEFRVNVLRLLLHPTAPKSTLPAMIDRGLGTVLAIANHNGWNALFHYVLNATKPDTGEELAAICILLGYQDDIFAQDCDGLTLFERTDIERPERSWANDGGSENWFMEYVREEDDYEELVLDACYESSPESHGSYQQDLLYCALLRNGLHTHHEIPPLPVGPTFTDFYRPHHYRALLYLRSWDVIADSTVMANPLLGRDPLCDEEREHAPAFHDWDISDLSMMERRLGYATFTHRRWVISSEVRWSDGSAEEDTEGSEDGQSHSSAEEDPGESESERMGDLADQEELPRRSENEWSDDSGEEGGVLIG